MTTVGEKLLPDFVAPQKAVASLCDLPNSQGAHAGGAGRGGHHSVPGAAAAVPAAAAGAPRPPAQQVQANNGEANLTNCGRIRHASSGRHMVAGNDAMGMLIIADGAQHLLT